MQLKLTDGTRLDVLVVNGKSVYTQGAQRDALEIQVAKGAISIDKLDALTADSTKTSKLTLIDGDKQYIHDNYSIRTELAIKPVVTTPATSTAPEVSEDRLCVTLAQLTYTEIHVAQQAAALAALGQQVVALSLGGVS